MSIAIPSLRGAIAVPGWAKNELWRRARAVPSLDLRFAENKSLVDATTGLDLVTFSRTSDGTATNSSGNLIVVPAGTPRFDHNPLTGESLGLLVEESRTNLLLRSEEFDNASWGKTNAVVTANNSTSPAGLVSADSFTDSVDSSATVHAVTTNSISFVSGQPYCISVFAKAQTSNGFAFVFPSIAFTASLTARFDLANGTLGLIDSGITASILPFGNGWYRCTAVATATASASSGFQLRIGPNAATFFYQGGGTGAILIWGAQLEAGAFPTSYIPTGASAVTRAADVCSISGSNFSSWYSSIAGTMYAEWITPVVGGRAFHAENATRTNAERFGQRVLGNFIVAEVASNGIAVNESNAGAGAVSYGTTLKTCAAFDSANVYATFKGVTESTALANGGPECGELLIGSYRGTATFANGPIARLTFWPQLLPISALNSITQ
jgi:hypothetical protein